MTIHSLSDFSAARDRLRQAYADLGTLLDEDGGPEADRQRDALRNALDRLEDARFTVGVVGQMNAGKSTLLNALLFGREVLAADPNPHTAKLTEIRHGPAPRATVHFFSDDEWREVQAEGGCGVGTTPTAGPDGAPLPGTSLALELDADRRADDVLRPYVAVPPPTPDPDAPVYTPLVRNVDLEFPLDRWPESTVWIDTPGTNDPVAARSQVTLDKLGDLDAVLVVLYAQQALGRDDLDLLADQLLPTGLRHLVVVVNKTDALTDRAAADDVERYVRETLLDRADALTPTVRRALRDAPVFGVSGLAALFARAGGDVVDADFYRGRLEQAFGSLDELEAASGLPDLEAHLGQFLAEQKGSALIRDAAERAVVVTEGAAERATGRADLAHQESRDLHRKRDDLLEEIQALEAEKRELTKTRGDLTHRVAAVAERELARLLEDTQDVVEKHRTDFRVRSKAIVEDVRWWKLDRNEAPSRVRSEVIDAATAAGDEVRAVVRQAKRAFDQAVTDALVDELGPQAVRTAADALAFLRWDRQALDLPTGFDMPKPPVIGARREAREALDAGFEVWKRETEQALWRFEGHIKEQTSEAVRDALDRAGQALADQVAAKERAVQTQKSGAKEIASRAAALDAEGKQAADLADRLTRQRDRLVALTP